MFLTEVFGRRNLFQRAGPRFGSNGAATRRMAAWNPLNPWSIPFLVPAPFAPLTKPWPP